MLHKVKYFLKNEGICGADFENRDRIININKEHVTSLSNLEAFKLPFSGKFVGKYATLNLLDGSTYFIREDEYKKLNESLNH